MRDVRFVVPQLYGPPVMAAAIVSCANDLDGDKSNSIVVLGLLCSNSSASLAFIPVIQYRFVDDSCQRLAPVQKHIRR
jgi:hypothetical protein